MLDLDAARRLAADDDRFASQLDDVTTALKGQVSDAQDVDMAETLSRLSQTQTQLQASYQLIAMLRGLSLANVLGGG
jgi:flagellar hook-associated protein 3 FlgL